MKFLPTPVNALYAISPFLWPHWIFLQVLEHSRAHLSFKAFACVSPVPQNVTLPDVHVIGIFFSGFASSVYCREAPPGHLALFLHSTNLDLKVFNFFLKLFVYLTLPLEY